MPLNLEPPDPSLEPAVDPAISAGSGIERFFWRHGIFLDLEAEGEDRGKGVGELQDTDGAYEAGDVAELRDGSANNPGEYPVGGHECYPEPFAGFAGEGWSMEELLEDFNVGNFDADVAVERSGDQSSDDIHDVSGGLPVVGGEALHHGVEGVLALVGVDKETEKHVDDVDEDVGAEDSFPEIPGVAHLGKEGDEEHSAAVGVDSLVETVEGTDEARSSTGHSVRWCASISVDGPWPEAGSEGSHGGLKVGRGIGGNSHTNQLSVRALRNGALIAYTMKIMSKLIHTAKFANQPNLCRVRICPMTIPAAIKMTRQTMKQMLPFET